MTTKKKVCKKGFPCGKSCISKTRTCWANLSKGKNKVAESFTQFIDRLIGVGYNPYSNLPNPLDSPQPKVDLSDIDRSNMLGEGSFGKVYEQKDGILIKEGEIDPLEADILKELTDKGFNHSPKLIGSHFLPEAGLGRIAMEKIIGFPPIKDNKDQFRADLVNVVREMHGLGVVHNDIHEGNILIDEKTNKINLIDFGMGNLDRNFPDPGVFEFLKVQDALFTHNLLELDQADSNKFFNTYIDAIADYQGKSREDYAYIEDSDDLYMELANIRNKTNFFKEYPELYDKTMDILSGKK